MVNNLKLLLFMLFLLIVALSFRVRAEEPVGKASAFTVMREFYAQRDYKPVWTGRDRFSAQARDLPAILSEGRFHGLDPEDYGISRMQGTLESESVDWKQAETLWTYGLWAYASDLWGRPIDAMTLESIVDGNIADNLAALAPDTPLYQSMQTRLRQLEEETRHPQSRLVFDFGKKTFQPGMRHHQIPALRAVMNTYLPGGVPAAGAPMSQDPDVYDQDLASLVGIFQKDHGLKNDGAIGPVTTKIFNRDPKEEQMQIAANMQRLREPHRRVREERRVEVSIARYTLSAFDGGNEVLSMPVIVGKPKRQTISFRTEISGVRLNPTWTVPTTIKHKDFIPELMQDAVKFTKEHGVKLVMNGRTVEPTALDWTRLSSSELAQLGMWSPAGEGNPTG